MMKQFYLLFISFLLCSLSGYSQFGSNEVQVIQVPEPIRNINYNSPDSTDIVALLRNVGPNRINDYDSLYFNYSISQIDTANVSTAYEYDTTIVAGNTIGVGATVRYTVAKNFQMQGSGKASICVDIKGTWEHPTNISKSPFACSQFIVGIEEVDIRPSKIYFSNRTLFFEISEAIVPFVQVFDLTGKVLMETQLQSNQKQSIPFNVRSKGFYFLKVSDKKGNSSTSKFVVN